VKCMRTDGSGHVVMMQPGGRGGYKYVCYQQSLYGRDLTEEFERICRIYLQGLPFVWSKSI
jgi:hypothetical protein